MSQRLELGRRDRETQARARSQEFPSICVEHFWETWQKPLGLASLLIDTFSDSTESTVCVCVLSGCQWVSQNSLCMCVYASPVRSQGCVCFASVEQTGSLMYQGYSHPNPSFPSPVLHDLTGLCGPSSPSEWSSNYNSDLNINGSPTSNFHGPLWCPG